VAVGLATLAGEQQLHGFVASSGIVQDLNSLLDAGSGAGWGVAEAVSVNSSGQIAANACKTGLGCQAPLDGARSGPYCKAQVPVPPSRTK
jgi:hypothetical protein